MYNTSDCRNNLKKNILSITTSNCQILIIDFTTSIHFCISVFETFIDEVNQTRSIASQTKPFTYCNCV